MRSSIDDPIVDHEDRAHEGTPDGGPAEPAARSIGVRHLAAALGINRRTIYKLRQRGAPADCDEASWRAWMRAEGIRSRPVVDLDIDIVVPRGADSAGTQSTAIGGDGALNPPIDAPSSWAQTKSKRDAEHKQLLARKTAIEIAALERELIHRNDVAHLMSRSAAAIISELVDLPARAIEHLATLPVEWKKPVRRAIEQAIEAARRRMVDDLRQRLGHALNGQPPVGQGQAGTAT